MKELLTQCKFIQVVTLLIIFLCFGMLFYMLSSRFPADKINMSSDIKIAVIQLLTGVVGFWVGSSSGSAKKDETVDKLIDNNKTIPDEKNSNTAGS